MIPSEIIKTILETQKDGALLGYSIVGGSEPAKPDKVITCIDFGGEPPNPKWLLNFPSVQVVVRAPTNSYKEAYKIAEAVKDLCLGITAYDFDGGRLDGIPNATEPFYIGRDENQRHKFTVNFDLIVEPTASALTHREAL